MIIRSKIVTLTPITDVVFGEFQDRCRNGCSSQFSNGG